MEKTGTAHFSSDEQQLLVETHEEVTHRFKKGKHIHYN